MTIAVKIGRAAEIFRRSLPVTGRLDGFATRGPDRAASSRASVDPPQRLRPVTYGQIPAPLCIDLGMTPTVKSITE